jgi:putative endonuclease
MEYFVYILFSEKDEKLYVGCTSNLEHRLKAHEQGIVEATHNRRPLTLIHSEKFLDKTEAFNRERFLKSLWGGRFKQRLKSEFLKRRNIGKG